MCGMSNQTSSRASQRKIVRDIILTYTPELTGKPLIWQIGQKFKIVTNICGMSRTDNGGTVALEISGPEQEVLKAIAWLQKKDVRVEFANEQNSSRD